MSITMKDVATYAAVSTATVSRVLSRPDLVNEETRRRVLEAVEALGYRMNTVARSLRTSQTGAAAVMVASLKNPFVNTILEGMQQAAFKDDYSLQLNLTGGNPEREISYIHKMLYEQRVDGILYVMLDTDELSLDVAEMLHMDMPVIVVNGHIDGLPSFFPDYEYGARLLVRTLVTHQNIAFLTADLCSGSLGRLRLGGYQAAMAEVDKPPIIIDSIHEFWMLDPLPDALVMCDSRLAAQVYQSVVEHGLRIPDDISVVGFHDFPLVDYLTPELTTVRYPAHQLGNIAFGALLSRVQESEDMPWQAPFPPQLAIRFSVR